MCKIQFIQYSCCWLPLVCFYIQSSNVLPLFHTFPFSIVILEQFRLLYNICDITVKIGSRILKRLPPENNWLNYSLHDLTDARSVSNKHIIASKNRSQSSLRSCFVDFLAVSFLHRTYWLQINQKRKVRFNKFQKLLEYHHHGIIYEVIPQRHTTYILKNFTGL